MKKIDISTPTFPDMFTLVDDDCYDKLVGLKWRATWIRDRFYVVRSVQSDRVYKRSTVIFMHRWIMNPPKTMQVDHINGNGIDNRKINLRVCTHAENKRNGKSYKNNSSGYKGVYWNKRDKRWRSNITVNGKVIYIGNFTCLIRAAKAYDTAARKHFGEFVKTNFK